MNDGYLLRGVHPRKECMGPHCPIHKPSKHHLSDCPQTWDVANMGGSPKINGSGSTGPMVCRTCVHGQRHPDPDGYWIGQEGEHLGCDGCCWPEDHQVVTV